VLYCKYECVIQRVASLICKLTNVTMHVNKNMHVFARGDGNEERRGALRHDS
jgi:hypothetical protein